jgi:hypothetical protein
MDLWLMLLAKVEKLQHSDIVICFLHLTERKFDMDKSTKKEAVPMSGHCDSLLYFPLK